MNVPERLLQLRNQAGETQKQTAESIGTIAESYRRYELGTREPMLKFLIALADHFNTSTDYILGRTDNPSPPLQ